MKSQTLLHQTFGFNQFRANQEAVCRAATDGRDVLLVMPTGAGKSLCYQLPAIARGGTALVISPLIALMDDQAAKLTAAGLRVARIHSGLSRDEARQACRDYLDGTLQFLFIAPERMRVPGFPEMLARRKPPSSPSTRPTASPPGATTSAPTTAPSATSSPPSAPLPHRPHRHRHAHCPEGHRRPAPALKNQPSSSTASAATTSPSRSSSSPNPAATSSPPSSSKKNPTAPPSSTPRPANPPKT
jgi:hypothetical protein